MNLQTFEVKIALKSDENILNKIVDKDISSFHLHLEVLRDDKNFSGWSPRFRRQQSTDACNHLFIQILYSLHKNFYLYILFSLDRQ